MKIPITKLKAILLYFYTYTDSRLLGKVKLMKLFYFLDFTHIKKYGVPVTFDTYVKLEHGPIPSTIKNLIDTADDDIDNSFLSDTISIEMSEENKMHRIVGSRKFNDKDSKLFSENELKILQEVCLRFGDKNTGYIEKASHEEAPWKLSNMFDNISYSLAAKDTDSLISEEQIKFFEEITK